MKIKKVIIFIILILLVGCTKKTFTVDEFLDIADFNGYIISESTEDYKSYKYVKNVYYAFNREAEYFIQLLVLDSDDYARKFYTLNMEEIAENKDKNSYVKTMNSTDYNLYHLETEEEYKLVIRSKEKIIYIDAPIDYINEIEEFLGELEIEY